jgi:Zn-dependent protease with chaperone function
MDLEIIINQAEYLKKEVFRLEPGATVEDLVKRIEFLYDTRIFIEPASLPNSVTGFCSIVKKGYLIQYDHNLGGRERIIVIGHELAHIVNVDIEHRKSEMKHQHVICYRNSTANETLQEKTAELMGLYLVAELVYKDDYEAAASQWFNR